MSTQGLRDSLERVVTRVGELHLDLLELSAHIQDNLVSEPAEPNLHDFLAQTNRDIKGTERFLDRLQGRLEELDA